MRLRYLQSVFYKGSYNFPHRQIKVVQAQIVVVLYGKMVFMEIAFQNSCRLCSIRECKPDMLTAFLLQFSKAFFFQQCAVIDNSNIVSQQGNLRKKCDWKSKWFFLLRRKAPE